MTTANTPSSSRAVVPPRVATASGLPNETKTINPKASAVVKTIATHGVRRVGCTLPSTGGSTRCLAIP